MRSSANVGRYLRLGSVSLAALAAMTSVASAGGFSIGEQSTVFMGTASAGAAAGGSIGSMYWNPAATAALPGTNTESSYTLILPDAEATVTNFNGAPIPAGTPGSTSGNIGIDAVTSASYGTYQVSPDLWLGMAINSPFGLATKPDHSSYLGSMLGVTTKLITIDANPTVAYKIAPGITIGAGVQIMWAQGKLQFDETPSANTAQFLGVDWAFGGTAGIMVEPVKGTTIGLGYRSQMDLDLDGYLKSPLSPVGPVRVGAVGTIKLPDLVTLSFRHELTPTARLLGTVEWTNWSRFKSLDLTSDLADISVRANWSDGWFFSLGGEYDYSPALTLRSGVAYELSPEDSALKRFTTIPDNNRVWLNLGASYQWSESLTFDVAYSHIFVQDGGFKQVAPSPVFSPTISGDLEMSADLISVGMRSRW